MPQALNTIARCEAVLANGEQIVYSDWEPAHVRQGRFRRILDGQPLTFAALTVDGERFSVDLVSGDLSVGGEHFTPQPSPTTPLRLIYYKHMTASAEHPEPVCEYFVVGWQTTTPEGRNLKIGLKAFPGEARWEITEDI